MQTTAGAKGQVKVVERGERRGGGEKRRGKEIDVTHEREKDRGGRFFSWNLHSFVYLPSDFMHIVVCSA